MTVSKIEWGLLLLPLLHLQQPPGEMHFSWWEEGVVHISPLSIVSVWLYTTGQWLHLHQHKWGAVAYNECWLAQAIRS